MTGDDVTGGLGGGMGTGRIHFTFDDLARTRVAAPDPVTETLFAVKFLRRYDPSGPFPRWQADARARLAEGAQMRLLGPLLPGPARCVDLFTLCGHTGSVDGAVETLRTRTARHLHTEIAYADAAFRLRLPSWTRHLAAADREWVGLLGTAIQGTNHAVLGPYWPRIQRHLTAERAGHGRVLLDLGVEPMLAGLHPTLRWESPVLEFPYMRDRDFHLGGRGLIVVPSVFCRPLPVPVFDYSLGEKEPPEAWLFVPSGHSSDALMAQPAATRGALTALLGHTRAAVLRATAAGPLTTSELAGRVGTSVATASKQATVLRDAGLITTHRIGKAVLHTITAAGETLLAGEEPDTR